jgi:2-oxoglutarate ferredoxin oxidoreductase subunit delta
MDIRLYIESLISTKIYLDEVNMSDIVINDAQASSKLDESAREQRKPRGKVTIFGLWCKGCGLCVEFCPTGVFELNEDDHPQVVYPERCTACHWCDTHCPDLAIVVKRIEE